MMTYKITLKKIMHVEDNEGNSEMKYYLIMIHCFHHQFGKFISTMYIIFLECSKKSKLGTKGEKILIRADHVVMLSYN